MPTDYKVISLSVATLRRELLRAKTPDDVASAMAVSNFDGLSDRDLDLSGVPSWLPPVYRTVVSMSGKKNDRTNESENNAMTVVVSSSLAIGALVACCGVGDGEPGIVFCVAPAAGLVSLLVFSWIFEFWNGGSSGRMRSKIARLCRGPLPTTPSGFILCATDGKIIEYIPSKDQLTEKMNSLNELLVTHQSALQKLRAARHSVGNSSISGPGAEPLSAELESAILSESGIIEKLSRVIGTGRMASLELEKRISACRSVAIAEAALANSRSLEHDAATVRANTIAAELEVGVPGLQDFNSFDLTVFRH